MYLTRLYQVRPLGTMACLHPAGISPGGRYKAHRYFLHDRPRGFRCGGVRRVSLGGHADYRPCPDSGTARYVPFRLLDSAFHDPRNENERQVGLSVPASGSGCGAMCAVRPVLQTLPDGAGCRRDGADRTSAKQRMHPLGPLHRPLRKKARFAFRHPRQVVRTAGK